MMSVASTAHPIIGPFGFQWAYSLIIAVDTSRQTKGAQLEITHLFGGNVPVSTFHLLGGERATCDEKPGTWLMDGYLHHPSNEID
jgi:hypothetical protein